MASAEESLHVAARPGAASTPGRRFHLSVILIFGAGVAAAGWIFEVIAAQERARAEAEFPQSRMAQQPHVPQTLKRCTALLPHMQML